MVYPAVGEQTLKDLVAEAKATESRRRAQVRTVLTGSYSHHYRTMLPKLLDALAFRCHNTAGVVTGAGSFVFSAVAVQPGTGGAGR